MGVLVPKIQYMKLKTIPPPVTDAASLFTGVTKTSTQRQVPFLKQVSQPSVNVLPHVQNFGFTRTRADYHVQSKVKLNSSECKEDKCTLSFSEDALARFHVLSANPGSGNSKSNSPSKGKAQERGPGKLRH